MITVRRERYSWGQLVILNDGTRCTVVLHPEDYAVVSTLDDGMCAEITDEQSIRWNVARTSGQIKFSKLYGCYEMTVQRSQILERQ